MSPRNLHGSVRTGRVHSETAERVHDEKIYTKSLRDALLRHAGNLERYPFESATMAEAGRLAANAIRATIREVSGSEGETVDDALSAGAVRDYRKRTLTPTTMEAALRLTESNLTSLINAQHHDAVLMSDWRKVVREALGWTQGDF